jgi:hypothetical protein
MGNPPPPPPQGTMYVKRRTDKFLGNCVLHSKMTSQRMELLLSEGLGEDVCHLFYAEGNNCRSMIPLCTKSQM